MNLYGSGKYQTLQPPPGLLPTPSGSGLHHDYMGRVSDFYLGPELLEKICEMSHNDLFVYAFEMARELLCSYMEITLKKRVHYWNPQKQKGGRGIICIGWF